MLAFGKNQVKTVAELDAVTATHPTPHTPTAKAAMAVTTNWYNSKGRSLVAEVAAAKSEEKATDVRWSSSSHMPIVPRPLVICGPSGSGKSTLLKRLMDEFGECFGFSVSHTTRNPRGGEVNGKEYHFVDRETMEKSISNGEFIEYTQFSGNYYGTSKKAVKEVQESGRICILDVEIEGVKNLKKTDLNPRFVFIKPPDTLELEKRLRGRGTDAEECIQKRLLRASEEMDYGETPGNFDLILVNDDIEEAYNTLRQFILHDVESLKKSRGM